MARLCERRPELTQLQDNKTKEGKHEKDYRYRNRAHGRGLRDSIRRKNVARGFDPWIACGQFVGSRRQLDVRLADDKELLAADVVFVATPPAAAPSENRYCRDREAPLARR